MARTLRTITVRELLEVLEGEDPDAKVLFTADYGDYHHTPQALPLRGELESVTVHESGYSASGWALDEDDDDTDTDGDTFLVIR